MDFDTKILESLHAGLQKTVLTLQTHLSDIKSIPNLTKEQKKEIEKASEININSLNELRKLKEK